MPKLVKKAFLVILERVPMAFEIEKINVVKSLIWEICFSAQLCHFLSIKNKLAITHSFTIKKLKKK